MWNYINVRVPFYFGSVTALVAVALFVILGRKIRTVK